MKDQQPQAQGTVAGGREECCHGLHIKSDKPFWELIESIYPQGMPALDPDRVQRRRRDCHDGNPISAGDENAIEHTQRKAIQGASTGSSASAIGVRLHFYGGHNSATRAPKPDNRQTQYFP